jgi:hypothetical protein
MTPKKYLILVCFRVFRGQFFSKPTSVSPDQRGLDPGRIER